MTRQELMRFLPGVTAPQFGAMNFAVLDEGWLLHTCWPAFWQWLRQQGISSWEAPYECRDFASDFRMFVVRQSAMANNRPPEMDGVAVGEIWFRPDKGSHNNSFDGIEGHAINPFISSVDSKLKALDPQNGSLWSFSPAEWASVLTYPMPCVRF